MRKFSNFQKNLIACDSRDHDLVVCPRLKAKSFFCEFFFTIPYIVLKISKLTNEEGDQNERSKSVFEKIISQKNMVPGIFEN